MSGRTLSDTEIQDAIRRPSFELQQAAIVAGYRSVNDFILAEAVEEIRTLKERVERLERVSPADVASFRNAMLGELHDDAEG